MSAIVLVVEAVSGGVGVAFLLSDCDFRTFLGDESMVVGAVVAVRGRSLESPDAAALEDVGAGPLNSRLLMRDFRSSSSSHTVSAG